MKEMTNGKECELRLKEFGNKTDQLLMIDGQTLDVILADKKLEELFFSVST